MRRALRFLHQSQSVPLPVVALALVVSCAGLQNSAWSHEAPPADPSWWRSAAIEHARSVHVFQEAPARTGSAPTNLPTPSEIPSFEVDPDPSGHVASEQPAGPTRTATNAFFQNLGTNQRTCFTCHQPQTGWTITAGTVQRRFTITAGADPLFSLVDGATCPNDDVSTPAAQLSAYSLLMSKGLIRIGLPLPASLKVIAIADPYGCSDNAVVNVTTARGTTPIYSFYRRPLPTTNLFFQTSNPKNAFMWDGREPSLKHQAIDATLIHAQAEAAPTAAQRREMTGFESGLFTAQNDDGYAQALDVAEASGGALALSTQPFASGAPQPSATARKAFDVYASWASLTGTDSVSQVRQSIARGEAIFNSTTAKSCATCHNAVDSGGHDNAANASEAKFFNTGVASANATPPPSGQGANAAALADIDISGLPAFTVACNDGSALQGKVFTVTDLGRAMITGRCADIGFFKTPSLRGLASRAPFFHNGSAATLFDVADFYNDNFKLGLTPMQINDLVHFMYTL